MAYQHNPQPKAPRKRRPNNTQPSVTTKKRPEATARFSISEHARKKRQPRLAVPPRLLRRSLDRRCNYQYIRCRLQGGTDPTPTNPPEVSDRCATEAQRHRQTLVYSTAVLSRGRFRRRVLSARWVTFKGRAKIKKSQLKAKIHPCTSHSVIKGSASQICI